MIDMNRKFFSELRKMLVAGVAVSGGWLGDE